MKLMLAGGGDAQQSHIVDEWFASWLTPQSRITYWPVALRGMVSSWSSCYSWIRDVLRPFGLRRIEMWTDLSAHDTDELLNYDAVYMGGGNTFSLLQQLRRSRFDRALRGFAQAGGIIYGGSAGAIVLGTDIMTAAHTDKNEVGVHVTNGLNLMLGHGIWCHYKPEDDPLAQAYVREYGWPVLLLSERSGVAREDGRLLGVGEEPVAIMDISGKQYLSSGGVPLRGR